jgi:hypothetical protein
MRYPKSAEIVAGFAVLCTGCATTIIGALNGNVVIVQAGGGLVFLGGMTVADGQIRRANSSKRRPPTSIERDESRAVKPPQEKVIGRNPPALLPPPSSTSPPPEQD